MRRLALGAGLWIALLSGTAGAQAPRAVRVIAPACAPGWWSEAGFDAALSVEIVALGVAVAPSAIDTIAIELTCDGESEPARLRAVVGAVTIEREADLSAVAAAVRIRILALAAHDALAEAIATHDAEVEAEAEAGAEAEADAGAEVEAEAEAEADAQADAEAGAEASGRSEAHADARDGLAARLGAPGAAAPSPRTLSIGVRGRAAVLPGPVIAGGAVIDVEMVLAPLPIALVAGVGGALATAGDALGEVRGGWADLLLGARAFADLAPVRLDASLALALAYVHTEGASARADVVLASRDAFALALEPAIAASIAIVPELRVVLAAGARIWLLGHEARAADRRGLALVDAAPFVELGVAIAP